MRREIPPPQWAQALESFTLQHDRWLVTVETIRDGQQKVLLADKPLDGVTTSGIEGSREIVITTGGSTSSHNRMTIRDAARLEIESADGVDQAIRIEDGSGTVTEVKLRTPMPPELVDGM